MGVSFKQKEGKRVGDKPPKIGPAAACTRENISCSDRVQYWTRARRSSVLSRDKYSNPDRDEQRGTWAVNRLAIGGRFLSTMTDEMSFKPRNMRQS